MNLKRLLKHDILEPETPPEFIQKLEDDLMLSNEVKKFLESPVGKYIRSCIEADKKSVKEELTKVDAWDLRTIAGLQDKYKLVCTIETYLAKALIAGNQASQQLIMRGS